jgi:serine/threonine protein kinase
MTESAKLPSSSLPASSLAATSLSMTQSEWPACEPIASTVPPPLEIGSRVGSFQLQRLISQGPSTAVYVAQDTTLGVDVAIKEFRLARGAAQLAFAGSSAGSPTHVQLEPAVERGLRAFVEEARMLARASHPSLLSVRGLFESQGTAYRVMPLYSATGLTELRASMPRPPDEPSVRAVMHHLLGALEALHANGHVHGALNADNVLLLPDDRPLLLGPGSAAREAAFLRTSLRAAKQPEASALSFADQVSSELRDLADLAEFCITGVQRPAGHARAPQDTVTASIVRELGAVELRHYSPAFLSVLDVASSARSEDRPLNTAQFANWLGSHELRRLKHQPPQTLVPTRADDSRSRQSEWAVTVPPAFWNEPAPEVATPSPADREYASAQDSMSTSQIWADTVQVMDDNPPPTRRTTLYPPQPMPQARPNFEQRKWEARKWVAGFGVLGVGLIAALVFVLGGSKDATLPSDVLATQSASTATAANAALSGLPVRPTVQTSPGQPTARTVTLDKPASGVVAGPPPEMPEIRLPVAAPFRAASAASAPSATAVAAVAASTTVAAAAAAAAVVPAALPRTEPAIAKPVAKAPASGNLPKGVKMSQAAWANGPRALCSTRSGAAASSCLKTQCRARQWASHPQCSRAALAKTAG